LPCRPERSDEAAPFLTLRQPANSAILGHALAPLSQALDSRADTERSGYRVLDANGIILAHVYGQPDGALATSDARLTKDEACRISKLISRLPELVELERDRNKARSRRKPLPLRFKPVTVGDLIRDGKLLEAHCGNCRPERHLYLNPEILRVPKRMPVPEVAGHLVCKQVRCQEQRDL
jgi:hypothetical protein